ncbi:hypothetical protein EMPS_10689 [Entomortierella parvispora]|uniref:Uncharacterized protein n=1 Tax=Entomortierella parvispora TaxID=205924 RepID=A0A9P3HKC6_9FUNG|nr:hypothetical protein EMPS_10689 [Entomortierella parvispora]
MPKQSVCSFLKCSLGLDSSERENFSPPEETHWKLYHEDDPVKFDCPYTGEEVEIRRNPQRRYFFTCVCNKSVILNSGSVKRHYSTCEVAERIARASHAAYSAQTARPTRSARPTNPEHSAQPANSQTALSAQSYSQSCAIPPHRDEEDQVVRASSPALSSASTVVSPPEVQLQFMNEVRIDLGALRREMTSLTQEVRRLVRLVEPKLPLKEQ